MGRCPLIHYMKLLIDCDFIVYKSCAATESEIDFGKDVILVTSLFSEALACTRRELNKISQHFESSAEFILFFSDSTNFRKKILPSYKGHRNRKKPCGYKRVVNALKKEYEVIVMPTLEADDSMGIYATKHPGNVIVSPDKDMKQIPGQLFNLDKSFTITKEQGAKWHLEQSISGDTTDGYAGIPTYGVKRAQSLFHEKGYTWKTVVGAYKEMGLNEDDALVNARLARILTSDDYDFERKKPILWSPSSDYRING